MSSGDDREDAGNVGVDHDASNDPPQPVSQRAMFAAYFGLDREPAVRPDPRADLLWLVPLVAVIVGLMFRGDPPSAIGLALVLFLAVAAYAVALRVRFLNRLDERDGVRQRPGHGNRP